MSNLRTFLAGPIARGTLVSLLIRVVGIGLGVVQAILTARLLGPEGYGAVAFVLSISMIFATVALAGTEMLAVREVARCAATGDGGQLHGFLRASRRIIIAAMVLCAGVLALILPLTPLAADFRSVMIYAVFIFPLLTLTLQNQGVLRGLGRTALSQIPFQIVRPVILVGVLVAFFLLGREIGPAGYLTAVLIGAGCALALALLTAARFTPALSGDRRPVALPTLARQSAPFFAISVLGLALTEISTLMLAWWSTPEETGLFQPIARIAPLLLLGAHAASVRYTPRVSEYWAKGEIAQLNAVTRTYTWTTTLFTLTTIIAILILGDWILGLFGEAFRANLPALYWLAGAQMVNALVGPTWSLLTMTGHTGRVLISHGLGLTTNVALGALLIPNYGVIGAAMAMAGGIVVWNIAMLIQVWRRLPVDPSILSLFRRPA